MEKNPSISCCSTAEESRYYDRIARKASEQVLMHTHTYIHMKKVFGLNVELLFSFTIQIIICVKAICKALFSQYFIQSYACISNPVIPIQWSSKNVNTIKNILYAVQQRNKRMPKPI